MSDVINQIFFQILPLGLYLLASLIMSLGVLPVVSYLYQKEREYRSVAFLMMVISATQLVTAIAALLYLYCFLYGCNLDESPYRGGVRLIIALNIFSSSAGFFILYNRERIRKWLIPH